MKQTTFGTEEMEENTSGNGSMADSSSNEDESGSERNDENNSKDEESTSDSDGLEEDSGEDIEDEESGEEDAEENETGEGEENDGSGSSEDLEEERGEEKEECDDSEEDNKKEGDDEEQDSKERDSDQSVDGSDTDDESGDDRKLKMKMSGQETDEESDQAADKDSKLHLLSTKDKKGSKKPTKPGIIYMSRIPPFMKPKKLRFIFGQYGEVGRIFLQQEDKNLRKFRKKKGGSRSLSYTEGWIEFNKKKIAKRVAITFNNTRIGDRKRSRYYDDLWNIKYLPRFHWAHLMERLEYEKQVRQQRIRTEVMQSKKETNFYMQNVEQQKVIERMTSKKRKQGKEWDFQGRNFKQWKTEEEREEDRRMLQEEMPQRSGKVTSSVLGKIFKK